MFIWRQAPWQISYTINDDWLTVTREGAVYAEERIEIDPTKRPKQLVFQLASGQTDLTIYTRVGDLLIQCGRPDGVTWPTEFETGTEKGGDYLIVLRRQK